MRGNGRRSHAVLPRAGLGNDARLAHFYRQQPLPDSVVDFVRAGVKQIFALQINPWPAQLFRQTRSELQRRRTPRKVL